MRVLDAHGMVVHARVKLTATNSRDER